MKVGNVVRSVLRPLGVDEWAERKYWSLNSLLKANVELVPRREFREVLDTAIADLLRDTTREEFGDYLEFGVYNGVSMSVAHQALVAAELDHSRLIGFDSFEGMPQGKGVADMDRFKGGQLYFGENHARANLKRFGVDLGRVMLVKGWYEQTLTDKTIRDLQIRRTRLVMIDCVIYSSTVTVLEFLKRVLADRAVVVFDDWTTHGMDARSEGQRRALEEFLAANPVFQAKAIGDFAPNARVFMMTRRPVASAE